MKVRVIQFIGALAVLAAPVQLSAQPTGGEVELHIEASVQVPPDRATLPLTLFGRGKTERAALADLAAKEREVRKQLGEAGIDGASIKPVTEGGQPVVAFEASVVDAESCAAEAAGAAAAAAAAAGEPATAADAGLRTAQCEPAPLATAHKTLYVDLRDTAKLDALKLAGIDGLEDGYARLRPVYSQSDPVAARKKARDLAIAKARAEADAYAATMGYRVVRVVRVSNARPGISMNDLVSFVATIDDRSGRMQPSWFSAAVSESVAIDFVMVPN